MTPLDPSVEIAPIIVLACLNEERTLSDCCTSLGFGLGTTPDAEAVRLVLVDNGSTDATLDLMRLVEARSPPGRVVVEREPLRGYVPARCKAIETAAGMAGAGDVLIVQADADTVYGAGYVRAMMQCAMEVGPGHLLQAHSEAPGGDAGATREYLEAAAGFDERFAPWFLDDAAFDVVVDDKVCAYRLSDYRSWGGHTREFDGAGEEILGETTRLAIRARLAGARLVRCDAATAKTSLRRELENPGLAFAMAGWPRSHEWRERWTATHGTFPELLRGEPPIGGLKALGRERARHLLAMFGALPRVMRAILDGEPRPTDDPFAEHLARAPIVNGIPAPGALVEWALSLPEADLDAMIRDAAPWRRVPAASSAPRS